MMVAERLTTTDAVTLFAQWLSATGRTRSRLASNLADRAGVHVEGAGVGTAKSLGQFELWYEATFDPQGVTDEGDGALAEGMRTALSRSGITVRPC